MARSHDRTHTSGGGVEPGVSQDAADEAGCFVLSDGEHNQAVVGVAQPAFVETEVAGEERDRTKSLQQRYDGRIPGTGTPHLVPDLTDRNPPTAQELPLAVRDVLVQDVHAGTSSGA